MFNTNLSWIQNGEEITGGVNGSNAGLLNRTSVELLANTVYLNDYKVSTAEPFVAAELIPEFTVCKLGLMGMMIASNVSEELSSGLLAVSLSNILLDNEGLFLLVGKVFNNTSFLLGSKLYLGENGAITSFVPESPSITRVIGYSITNSNIYFNPQG